MQCADTGDDRELGALTARELEVLRLLARDMTDAQIVHELVLSRRTVHAHLRSIYSKLDVRSRLAAARWAYVHDLRSRRRRLTPPPREIRQPDSAMVPMRGPLDGPRLPSCNHLDRVIDTGAAVGVLEASPAQQRQQTERGRNV